MDEVQTFQRVEGFAEVRYLPHVVEIPICNRHRSRQQSHRRLRQTGQGSEKSKKKHVKLLAYDEQLRHYADLRITLDLDDGVKVNCGKIWRAARRGEGNHLRKG